MSYFYEGLSYRNFKFTFNYQDLPEKAINAEMICSEATFTSWKINSAKKIFEEFNLEDDVLTLSRVHGKKESFRSSSSNDLTQVDGIYVFCMIQYELQTSGTKKSNYLFSDPPVPVKHIALKVFYSSI